MTSSSACSGTCAFGGCAAGARAASGPNADADRLFGLCGVDIADRDDRHAIGPIPRVVERTKPRGRRRPQDFRFADRQPLGVPRAVEHQRQLFVLDALPGAEPPAPFFDDDAALLVDLVGIERQAAGEVGQRGEPARHDLGVVGRQLEHVDGLVEARIGVDVRPEPRARRLEVRHELARLEVRAAVERHVLDQVREPLLIVRFVQRSGLDREPQRDALFRTGVAADEIREPVRQRAAADGRIERDDVLRR